jgi:hypothetical protein
MELPLQAFYFHLELNVLPDKIRKEKKQCKIQARQTPNYF